MHVLKYVVFDDETAIVAPATLSHTEITLAGTESASAIRAGFVTFYGPDGLIHAFGGSESLGLQSDPGDARLIDRAYGISEGP